MTRNNADFHNVDISIKGHDDLDSALEHGGPWTIEAHLGDKRVGYLQGKGEVKDVWVDPEHRRKGIATALYRKAKQLGMVHSTHRTDSGEAWAKSTDDYFPRWLRVNNYEDVAPND